jgi:hypothetical protein
LLIKPGIKIFVFNLIFSLDTNRRVFDKKLLKKTLNFFIVFKKTAQQLWSKQFRRQYIYAGLNLLKTIMKALFFILAWPFCAISIGAAKSIAPAKRNFFSVL